MNTKGLIKSSMVILLSILLVTSLLAFLSMHATISGINGTTGTTEIPNTLNTSTKPDSYQITLVLYPTDDAEVFSGSASSNPATPDTNYGSTGRVVSRTWNSGTGNERSYFKFDIGTILQGSTIISAKLRLHAWTVIDYLHDNSGANWSDVEILGCGNNNWDESTITWNNQPDNTEDNLQSYYILWENKLGGSSNLAGYHGYRYYDSPTNYSPYTDDPLDNTSPGYHGYENDVSSYVNNRLSNGIPKISFVIKPALENYDSTYRGMYAHSKEGPGVEGTTDGQDNWPRLTIVYTPPNRGAVKVNVLPDAKENLPGTVNTFTVTVQNVGGIPENFNLYKGDNSGWGLTLTGADVGDNRLENMLPNDTRTMTLTVTIPAGTPIDNFDNVFVRAVGLLPGSQTENTSVTDTGVTVVHCTNSIKAIGDIYVDDFRTTTNFENNFLRLTSTDNTWVGVSPEPPQENRNTRIFIQFPLNGIVPSQTVASAQLELWCWLARNDDMDAQIYAVENDNWYSGNVKWNNQPAIDSVPLDTVTLTSWPDIAGTNPVSDKGNFGVENSVISWEVRSFVSGQRLVDNVVTFCIKAAVENASGDYMFGASELANLVQRPQLIITFGSTQRAVSTSISPAHRVSDNGVTENFTVSVLNKGNAIDNITLTSPSDLLGWTRTFDTSSFTNVMPGKSVTTTLHVAIPGGAAAGAFDNVKVTASGTGVTDNENVSVSVRKTYSWVTAGYAPRIDNYAVAVTSTGTYIYVANSNTLSSRVEFMRYDPTAGGSWTYLPVPCLDVKEDPDNATAINPFKTGTVLVWDKSNYIYALVGGSITDAAATNSARHWFLRYNISANTWTILENTGHSGRDNNSGRQGAGDAMTIDTNNSVIYAMLGDNQLGSTFWRYNILTGHWDFKLTAGWASTDNGASIVWTGGDNMFAFRGQSTTSFSMYSISGDSWTVKAAAPAAVSFGGSLFNSSFAGSDNIYSTLGAGSLFYSYSQKNNSWTADESLPKNITSQNGQRLGGVAPSSIYTWRGNQSDPVLWVYTVPRLSPVTGQASLRLATSQMSAPFLYGIYKAYVNASLTVYSGDNLHLKFLALNNTTVENDIVIWSRTAPGTQTVTLTNLIVPHDNILSGLGAPSDYVKRMRLVLTNSDGSILLDNMAWYKVVQDDWGDRISWIVINWTLHSSSQQDRLGDEISTCVLSWANIPFAPRDQQDFSVV